ncbi:hypothetical protein K8352_08700 [Flavobacteriaceae bacterium F89]|uniref:Uncharacterized protein n=1 Tax=Cerina litoralis TaxID=2874477 RepID=A0AAE3EW71_9FLAO|nr:hypothetical protein [Cerina litoralis]MCG2460826.1 hypothetical protein [Cerina litoralis]
MKEKGNGHWMPDHKTVGQIRKLKEFVRHVSNLEMPTADNTQNADQIISLLDTLENPGQTKNWNVCLDIFDHDVQYGYPQQKGFYRRKWAVYYELNTITIEAETNHTAQYLGHYGDNFCFYGSINFDKVEKGIQVFLSGDIEEFVSDAKNYNSYITETLNEIEIDIDIWELPEFH